MALDTLRELVLQLLVLVVEQRDLDSEIADLAQRGLVRLLQLADSPEQRVSVLLLLQAPTLQPHGKELGRAGAEKERDRGLEQAGEFVEFVEGQHSRGTGKRGGREPAPRRGSDSQGWDHRASVRSERRPLVVARYVSRISGSSDESRST